MAESRLVTARADAGGMLTPRQTQVMELLIKGMKYSEVAISLGVSGSAISSHVERICDRLTAGTAIEAAVKFDRMKR